MWLMRELIPFLFDLGFILKKCSPTESLLIRKQTVGLQKYFNYVVLIELISPILYLTFTAISAIFLFLKN